MPFAIKSLTGNVELIHTFNRQATSVEVDTPAVVQPAREQNFAWIVTRMSEQEDQLISSWTGLNILTRDDVTVVPHNVGYLPTINVPATHIASVNEVTKHYAVFRVDQDRDCL